MSAWHGRTGNILNAGGSPRTQLSTLAVTVSLDSFTKIKKAMDTMTADLKEEQAMEVKFKAHCDTEMDVTDKETFNKNEEREDYEGKTTRSKEENEEQASKPAITTITTHLHIGPSF